jgi:hypothetical protein
MAVLWTFPSTTGDVLFRANISGVLGVATLSILCIYIRPTAHQVDHPQATQTIQSILRCTLYITTLPAISLQQGKK